MIHDTVLSDATDPINHDERRQSARTPSQCELLVLWHHDPSTTVRYAVVDLSEGGVRIRTSTPPVQGMTGIAVRMLPEGTQLNRPVMVAWAGPASNEGSFDAGLRFY